MKASILLAVVIGSCFSRGLLAAPVSSCDRQPPTEQISQYQHVHNVTIRGLVRGPDGIELEVRKVIPAIDQLVVWHAEPDTICISLTAYDRDAHECSVDGAATKDASDKFVLSDGSCVIRFSIRADSAGMGVLGDGCAKPYCAGKGVMEDATFVGKR